MTQGAQTDVLIRMNAAEGRAVQGFRNLTTAQRRTERQTRRLNRSNRQMQRGFDRVGSTARTLGAGLGIAGLAGIARQLGRAFEESNRKAHEFEGSIRGVIAVGDQAGQITEIREEIGDMMTQWGISTEAATGVMATMEDRAGSLESRFSRELEPSVMRFARLMDTDANRVLNTSISLLRVYGDEIDSTDQLLDLLKTTADAGAVSIEDLTGRMGEMAPVLEHMGLGLREYLAAIATASEYGMEANRVVRGMESMVRSFVELQREGELAADTLPNMLTELAQRGEDLDEILPSTAAQVAAALLDGAQASDDLRQNLIGMEDVTGLQWQAREAERLADSMQAIHDFRERTERIPEAAHGRVPERARHFGAIVERSQAEIRAMMQEAGLGAFAGLGGFLGIELADMLGFGEAMIGAPLTRAATEHRLMERTLRGRPPGMEDFADARLMGMARGHEHPFDFRWMPEAREGIEEFGQRRVERLEEEHDRQVEEREATRLSEQQLEEQRRTNEILQEHFQAYLQTWHALPPTQRMAREPSMQIERGRRNRHEE